MLKLSNWLRSEFGFEVEFIGLEDAEEEKKPKMMKKIRTPRSPIVTIMGHVDHGKPLLDYIRSANVGSRVKLRYYPAHWKKASNLLRIGTLSSLDTQVTKHLQPCGACGAKVTDIAVIVIAADDAVMPQTKEAISHA